MKFKCQFFLSVKKRNDTRTNSIDGALSSFADDLSILRAEKSYSSTLLTLDKGRVLRTHTMFDMKNENVYL